ncbi:hypothetical protein E2C01_015123 [Portunus trituberculatus]|uniref:Uncharacterized protein n=1 Tax=Portunus trituberculatus TaxID=210409 RepID=A0A5B7DMB0_PORTR|nr:hypothetical protein [Portunus trituberculatus]
MQGVAGSENWTCQDLIAVVHSLLKINNFLVRNTFLSFYLARDASTSIFFSVDLRYAKRATTASASSLEEDILAGSRLFTLTFTSRQGTNYSRYFPGATCDTLRPEGMSRKLYRHKISVANWHV